MAREQVVESAPGVEMPQGRIRGRPTAVWADWAALAAYTAAIYAFLPYGPRFGLALVRKVVGRMGGRLGVESQIGKGSRFWIELPGCAGS